jgi:proline dehydrogenase
MGVGRETLLWASRNPWLRRRVPRLPFVRRAVLKFMPGETLEAALEAAQAFALRGLPSTFTHLGENVATEEEADVVVAHYLEVLDRVARAGLDTEISVKLTHLGFDLGSDLSLRNLLKLVRAAGERRNWVWIDMESAPYVEGTISVYRQALESSSDVGLCLQAYLHRTPADLETLLALTPSIRLVKGAYREPPALALTRKNQIDQSYLRLSEQLLAERRSGRVRRFAVATHDLDLIETITRTASRDGIAPSDAFEVQMLYGIRQADQLRLARSGQPTRCLIAYGPAWYPWYMRRLAERPSNVSFVMRNLFGRPPLSTD